MFNFVWDCSSSAVDIGRSCSRVWSDKVYDAVYNYGTGANATPKRIFPDTEYFNIFSPPSHIIDNIFLGSAYNAASNTTLRDNDIKSILNMTEEISNYFVADVNFEYKQCKLYDNNKESISNYLEVAHQQIIDSQERGNILVHCYAGRSRSATVVIYYVMKKLNITPDEAIEYVKQRRPCINPTILFKQELENAYKNLQR